MESTEDLLFRNLPSKTLQNMFVTQLMTQSPSLSTLQVRNKILYLIIHKLKVLFHHFYKKCFHVEPPVRFIRPRKMAYGVEKLVGDTMVLECDVSRSNAEVSWKKDGEEIEENRNVTITEDGASRQLIIHSAALEDAGQYVCDARDDVMDFLVKIKGKMR